MCVVCLEAVSADPVGKCLDVHPPARSKPSARGIQDLGLWWGLATDQVTPSGTVWVMVAGYRLVNLEEYLCKEETWAL